MSVKIKAIERNGETFISVKDLDTWVVEEIDNSKNSNEFKKDFNIGYRVALKILRDRFKVFS